MKYGLWAVLIVIAASFSLGAADEPEADGTGKIFEVTVDYTKSIEEMIRLGQFFWVDSRIKNLLVKGTAAKKVKRNLTLLNLNSDNLVRTDEVIVEMEKRGLRPALIEDILAFHIQFPDYDEPIVALGTFFISGNSRLFPLLYRFQGQEKASLFLDGSRLWKDVYFLAVLP